MFVSILASLFRVNLTSNFSGELRIMLVICVSRKNFWSTKNAHFFVVWCRKEILEFEYFLMTQFFRKCWERLRFKPNIGLSLPSFSPKYLWLPWYWLCSQGSFELVTFLLSLLPKCWDYVCALYHSSVPLESLVFWSLFLSHQTRLVFLRFRNKAFKKIT